MIIRFSAARATIFSSRACFLAWTPARILAPKLEGLAAGGWGLAAGAEGAAAGCAGGGEATGSEVDSRTSVRGSTSDNSGAACGEPVEPVESSSVTGDIAGAGVGTGEAAGGSAACGVDVGSDGAG